MNLKNVFLLYYCNTESDKNNLSYLTSRYYIWNVNIIIWKVDKTSDKSTLFFEKTSLGNYDDLSENYYEMNKNCAVLNSPAEDGDGVCLHS